MKGIESLYTADAGGAFPGGVFGAGVNEVLCKEHKIVSAIGESAGAINTIFKAAGKAQEAIDIWMDALSKTPRVASFNPAEPKFWSNLYHNHTVFDVQHHVFGSIDRLMPVEDFKTSPIRARIIYTIVKGLGIQEKDEKIYWSEKLIQPFLFIPYIFPQLLEHIQKQYPQGTPLISLLRKINDFLQNNFAFEEGILDNRNLPQNPDTEELDKLIYTLIKASCSLPPFYGLPIKKDASLLIDGGFIDELGGAEHVIEEAKGDTHAMVCVITRYSSQHPKHIKRRKKLDAICEKNDFPPERVILISPEEPLPITSNYTNKLEELKECYNIGKQTGENVMKNIG